MSDGFVVASCGANSLSESKSPVSATTLVNFFNWSSWLMPLDGFWACGWPGCVIVLIVSIPKVKFHAQHAAFQTAAQPCFCAAFARSFGAVLLLGLGGFT